MRSLIARDTLQCGEQFVGVLAAIVGTAASVFTVVAGIGGHL
ncbi:hypothetical protein [Streptomyces sp. NPDC102264]